MVEKEQWHKSTLWEKSLWPGRPDIYLFTTCLDTCRVRKRGGDREWDEVRDLGSRGTNFLLYTL